MKDIKDHFLIGMFDQKLSQLLVFFALTGIALSIYPVYEGLYTDTSKKMELIQQWNGLEVGKLPEEAIEAVREQLASELKSSTGKVEATIALLSNKTSENTFSTYVWKFLTGMALLLITYGVMFIFYWAETGKKYRKHILRANRYIIFILIIMGVLNMFVPFMSIVVNYIFIPSCLALLVALIMLARSHAQKQAKESEESRPDI